MFYYKLINKLSYRVVLNFYFCFLYSVIFRNKLYLKKLSRLLVRFISFCSFRSKKFVFPRGKYRRIKHIRFYRYLYKLPMRGQRTHTNADTVKRQRWLIK